MSFPIDTGTAPPLTGPGVVAGWYEMTPSQLDGSTYLRFWETGSDDASEHTGSCRVGGNGEVWAFGGKTNSEPLANATRRLRARLGGFAQAYHSRAQAYHGGRRTRYPFDLAHDQLRTWLRELNLHPTTVRDAQETTCQTSTN
jgi:hypothetical protein